MPLPTTSTDIVNLALSSIGERTINNINNPLDEVSETMRTWYDICVSEVQTMIIWDELYTGPVSLSYVTDNYAGVQGQYQYILPTNFIQVIEVNAPPPQGTIPVTNQNPIATSSFYWKLQDGYLIARVQNFEMLYARSESDVTKWSNQQRELIISYIAYKISLRLTNNPGIMQAAKQEYMEIKNRVFASRQNRNRRFRNRPSGFSMTQSKNSSGSGIGYRGY